MNLPCVSEYDRSYATHTHLIRYVCTFRAYLNMTEAAARGDLEAERLLSYEAVFNISKLMGKIPESLEQEKRFNGGRLRIRYPLHAARVTCSCCNVSWERTPWTLNVLLNETIELTPLEWYSVYLLY